jgi:hypothetical protein
MVSEPENTEELEKRLRERALMSMKKGVNEHSSGSSDTK